MKDREIDEKRPEDVREVGEIEKGTVMVQLRKLRKFSILPGCRQESPVARCTYPSRPGVDER